MSVREDIEAARREAFSADLPSVGAFTFPSSEVSLPAFVRSLTEAGREYPVELPSGAEAVLRFLDVDVVNAGVTLAEGVAIRDTIGNVYRIVTAPQHMGGVMREVTCSVHHARD